MRMWVFRHAGFEGGSPRGTYDAEAAATWLDPMILRFFNEHQEVLDYSAPVPPHPGPAEFFFAELFERNTLRQGWGVPGLDVRRLHDTFIPNYVVAAWKYWGVEGPAEAARRHSRNRDRLLSSLDPYFRRASGRYTILCRMNKMSVGGLVFVPKAMSDGGHGRGFTVARIAGPYHFEDREGQRRGTWAKDYGHLRPVKDLRSYEYSGDTLTATHFRSYRAAISEVASDHVLFRLFAAFIANRYAR